MSIDEITNAYDHIYNWLFLHYYMHISLVNRRFWKDFSSFRLMVISIYCVAEDNHWKAFDFSYSEQYLIIKFIELSHCLKVLVIDSIQGISILETFSYIQLQIQYTRKYRYASLCVIVSFPVYYLYWKYVWYETHDCTIKIIDCLFLCLGESSNRNTGKCR